MVCDVANNQHPWSLGRVGCACAIGWSAGGTAFWNNKRATDDFSARARCANTGVQNALNRSCTYAFVRRLEKTKKKKKTNGYENTQRERQPAAGQCGQKTCLRKSTDKSDDCGRVYTIRMAVRTPCGSVHPIVVGRARGEVGRQECWSIVSRPVQPLPEIRRRPIAPNPSADAIVLRKQKSSIESTLRSVRCKRAIPGETWSTLGFFSGGELY